MKWNKRHLTVSILPIFYGILLAIFSSQVVIFNNSGNVNGIQSSSGSIGIITPENTTYTGPMSDYYPATYGFENEDDGTTGTDIVFADANSFGTCIIEGERASHKKTLKVTSGWLWQSVQNAFSSSKANGTVEYWIRLDSAAAKHLQYFHSGVTLAICILWNNDGNFKYNNGTEHIICTYAADTWYHIRIDFECGDGDYQGLSPDTFFVYVDGDKYGPYGFYNSVDSVNVFTYQHLWFGVTSYLDAIEYSWEGYNNTGDNKDEGLLLSFIPSAGLHDFQYSLDNQTSISILGNYTIPYPSVGQHVIQVFGYDANETLIESNERYFTTQ